MAGKTLVSSELSRELTLFQITMMGLGMMIGAGVFLGLGNSIHEAGPGGAILTFVLNGVIATLTACSYAELSSAIPRAGGAYNYARIGFGRGPSFLAGWMEWFASSVAGSLYSLTFAIYVVRYLTLLGLLTWLPLSTLHTEKIVALLVAGFFFYINYRGASETGKIGAFFTLGQTAFLIFIGAIGIVVAIKDPTRLQNFDPFLPHGWSKLLITMGFTYVAFEGFEVIAQTGDEAINPRSNLPKAMLYSVCIVTITYAAVAFATIVSVKAGSPGVTIVPWKWIGQFKERGFGEAVSRLIPMGNLLLTLAVIFAATSALNATIYSATRALYALGRDHMVPPFIAKVSKKRKTPWAALLGTGVLVVIVSTFLPTMDVVSSASMMFIILFFLINICVIKVRTNMGNELTYGFLMPFFPYLPIIAIIAQTVLAYHLRHMSTIACIVAPLWILSGIAIYFFYSKSHAVATDDEIHILAEEKAPEAEGYRIMVAVATPKNAIEMAPSIYKLCRVKEANAEVLHIVTLPEQIPLSDADEYTLDGKEAVIEAMLYLQRFSFSSTIRYCRNVARGIVSAVREKKTDMLIIGWHGEHQTRLFNLGSTVDPIIERSPCNVVMLKDVGNKKFNRILVPVIGGSNEDFALEIATVLVEEEGTISVFTVNRTQDKVDLEDFVNRNRNSLQIAGERIIRKAINASNVVEAILEESEQYDLVVLGSIQKPLIYQVVKDSIPERVALRCTKPLVMVKAAGEIESWIKRWI